MFAVLFCTQYDKTMTNYINFLRKFIKSCSNSIVMLTKICYNIKYNRFILQ